MSLISNVTPCGVTHKFRRNMIYLHSPASTLCPMLQYKIWWNHTELQLSCCFVWIWNRYPAYRRQLIETTMLRNMYGPKRQEVTTELRKLQKEELHKLQVCSSPNILSHRWGMSQARGLCPCGLDSVVNWPSSGFRPAVVNEPSCSTKDGMMYD